MSKIVKWLLNCCKFPREETIPHLKSKITWRLLLHEKASEIPNVDAVFFCSLPILSHNKAKIQDFRPWFIKVYDLTLSFRTFCSLSLVSFTTKTSLCTLQWHNGAPFLILADKRITLVPFVVISTNLDQSISFYAIN